MANAQGNVSDDQEHETETAQPDPGSVFNGWMETIRESERRAERETAGIRLH